MKNQIVFEEITNKIIEKLESGVIPWKRTWGFAEPAQNHFSEHIYRGVNSLLILCEDYQTPFFATFKQIKENGGSVKKGTKATRVYYYGCLYYLNDEKISEKTFESLSAKLKNEVVKFPYLKSMNVFNMQDVEGIEIRKSTTIQNPDNMEHETAHAFVEQLKDKPGIRLIGNQPCYYPEIDTIEIPPMEQFASSEDFYTTFFHELTHSSGHKKRLNREGLTKMAAFGSPVYSREELIAELGACYFNNFFGIETSELLENSAAYIRGWIKALKGDVTLLVQASGHAQKAFNFFKSQVIF